MDTTIIILVALAAIAWLAFIVGTSVSGRGRDRVPRNITMYKTDDELESNRLDRALAAAVVFSAFLALAIPIYYLGEEDRQAGFEEEFAEGSLERGEELWQDFQCLQCHGPDGSGGSAPFIEARSGNTVGWAAPPLNDVLYRYTKDEVRFWIAFGRANTPMPPWGLEGGGPLNTQSIDDLVAYITTSQPRGLQITQEEALEQIEPLVERELARIDNGEQIVADAIHDQEVELAIISKAPAAAPIAEAVAVEAREILDDAGEGVDTDADSLSDISEQELTRLSSSLYVVEVEVDESTGEENVVAIMGLLSEIFIPEEAAVLGLQQIPVELDPLNPETTPGVPDAVAARDSVAALDALATNLRVSTDNQERLTENAEFGLAFLQASAATRPWDVDFTRIAADSFAGDISAARRSVGLFNAYCARCHTGSWSAGLPYTLEIATGGFAPALFEGRVNIQFTEDVTEDADTLGLFVQKGSEASKPYGVNGMGTGRMPAFGAILSVEDIDLIVDMLRGLGEVPDA